jgi:hypothetical protein
MQAAPLPQPPPRPESQTRGAPAIEDSIGSLVASAACLIVEGLAQHWHGGRMDGHMSPGTRRRGGELIALLIEVREATAGELDFDQVARSYGAKALRERNGDAVTAATIDSLVAGVLHILDGVVKRRMN